MRSLPCSCRVFLLRRGSVSITLPHITTTMSDPTMTLTLRNQNASDSNNATTISTTTNHPISELSKKLPSSFSATQLLCFAWSLPSTCLSASRSGGDSDYCRRAQLPPLPIACCNANAAIGGLVLLGYLPNLWVNSKGQGPGPHGREGAACRTP